MTPPRDYELPHTLDRWKVDLDSRGVWIATRREPLTREQAAYGVPLQLLAGTLGELELKAIAADVHAGIVAAAERMVARMLERQDERHRQADEKGTRQVSTPGEDEQAPVCDGQAVRRNDSGPGRTWRHNGPGSGLTI